MPEQIAPIQPADHRKRWRRPLLLLGAGLFLCPIGLCGTFADYGPGCSGMGSLLLSMFALALSLVVSLVALVILAMRRMISFARSRRWSISKGICTIPLSRLMNVFFEPFQNGP